MESDTLLSNVQAVRTGAGNWSGYKSIHFSQMYKQFAQELETGASGYKSIHFPQMYKQFAQESRTCATVYFLILAASYWGLQTFLIDKWL